ncbi:hypothetical protein DAEQUDRAFT_306355 [Daedalea quercina L-15889]|uniref:Cytochrome P450 n=1 Tax=Daedalea quercina L-15889 TaxID=1314783 RepID=A0A165Q255_9APHY|nr:hypothetical protein DAEQUDRAFT_306355 [Daedalea quercina L-15889]
MSGTIIALLLLTTAWIISHATRIYLAAFSLPKLPGPPPQSIWTGHLGQWFSREADAFQKYVALDYGTVVRLRGMIGWPILYVSDPKALHTILVQEQDSCLHRKELMEYVYYSGSEIDVQSRSQGQPLHVRWRGLFYSWLVGETTLNILVLTW